MENREFAHKLVDAYFDKKMIIVKEEHHGMTEWKSIYDMLGTTYLQSFCENVNCYKIPEERAICRDCSYKNGCTFITSNAKDRCPSVHISNTGYEEAMSKVITWLKGNLPATEDTTDFLLKLTYEMDKTLKI